MGERTSDGLNTDETEAARIEIERTRAHMGETLDHIGERLAPERFKAEAVEAAGHLKEEAIDTATHLKEAAVEAAKAMTEEVIGGVKHATKEVYDKARHRVNHTRYEIEGVTMPYVDTIRKNPLPAAMVGFGLYWLMQSFEENKRLHRRRRQARLRYGAGLHAETPSYNPYHVDHTHTETRSYNPYRIHESEGSYDRGRDVEYSTRDRAGEVISQTKERFSDTTDHLKNRAQDLTENLQDSASRLKQKAARRLDRVQESAHVARDQFETVLYENPMIVAAAAGAIGLIVGMLLPDTDIENETLGYKRDQFVHGAQEAIEEKASELKEKANTLKEKAINVAKETASVATETIKDQAAKEGLTESAAPSIDQPAVGVVGTMPASGLGTSPASGSSSSTGLGSSPASGLGPSSTLMP